jgi:hypothetical protein
MPNKITLTEVSDLATLGSNVIAAMQSLPNTPKRILQFDNFVYARKEVNKNRDEISAENLQELAATLPLNWIDWGHDDKKRTGFYIGAKVEDDAVLASGIIWTDDDPELPRRLAEGELQQSIEADAERAKCTVCGKEFTSEKQYCVHLAPLENRFRFNAVRQLFGMRATGGALVRNPAGTDTKADPNGIRMIAHVVMACDRTADNQTAEPPKVEPTAPQEVVSCLSELEYRLFRKNHALAKTLDTKERNELPDSDFALIQHENGKKIRRFPINDCAHARNALARLPVAKDLSDEERAQVERKAKAKLNSPECKKERQSAKSARAILAAQRFFATEWANTPTVGLAPWFALHPDVPPVISPLMYHPGPELQPAPRGKHPLTPREEVTEQVQKVVEQRVEAETENKTTAADARMGALLLTWTNSQPTSQKTIVRWKKE